MAVENGDKNAVHNLGFYHMNYVKDFKKATKYYKISVKMGHPISMYNLGSYYAEIKKDCKKGLKYYIMAIKNGADCQEECECQTQTEINKCFDEIFSNDATISDDIFPLLNFAKYKDVEKAFILNIVKTTKIIPKPLLIVDNMEQYLSLLKNEKTQENAGFLKKLPIPIFKMIAGFLFR